MTVNNGGIPNPESEAGKALAELEKEGHTVEGKEPVEPVVPVVPARVEEKKEPVVPTPEPKKPVEEPQKPNRPVTMVEAFKLNIVQGQKDALTKQVAELETQIKTLSTQGKPASQAQKDEIDAEIKAIADEAGIDAGILTKLADSILKRAQPSGEVVETVKKLNEEREMAHQVNLYSQEFDKVTPLVKEKFPGIPDTALSELKSKLQDLAFSEQYAKVPLEKIFLAELDSLDIQIPKKSAEARGERPRTPAVVDLENLSDEDFAKLSPEQVEEFERKKGTSEGWKKPGRK